jgi:PBP1b-binding outer membrane lipoprotein LpoB
MWSTSNALRVSLAAPALALLLAGCTQPKIEPRPVCDMEAYQQAFANPPEGEVLVPPTPGTVSPMPLNTVNITDQAIIQKVIVQASNATRTPTGTVEVWARLVNCTDFPLQIEGRTNFLTAGQAPAEQPTAWTRLMLPARAVGTYSAKSIATDQVATYLVEIREGQ